MKRGAWPLLRQFGSFLSVIEILFAAHVVGPLRLRTSLRQ